MERNWLIRTSQNQILGPVVKSKLLEFIQKGALGLTDEVASGNGYWFSLKERDLVDKYLYGDVPQGYNPISEAKSVLARRENPDKTTSLNSSPANHTQVIKLSDTGLGVIPKNSDLEFPDMGNTHSVGINLDFEKEGTKLPNQDDLEFPDVGIVSKNVSQTFTEPQRSNLSVISTPVVHSPVVLNKKEMNSDEIIALPNEDDLAFPDMDDAKTSTKIEKGKVDLDHQYTRTVALDLEQAVKVIPEIEGKSSAKTEIDLEEDSFEFKLDIEAYEEKIIEPVAEIAVVKEKPLTITNKNNDDKKLLFERKTKASMKPAAMRDPTREAAHSNREQSEPLKKRNDSYLFFILIILVLIIVAVFFYFKEILNKPLPV